MITITIATWYDTVTPESATEGDYESTGNECRSNAYDNLQEAVTDYVSKFRSQYWEIGIDYVNEVACATDPDTDHRTGAEHYDRLLVDVQSNETIRTKREKRIIKALNYLIDKKLSA